MSGGLDILIVGIANKSLDSVASDERLKELFGDGTESEAGAERYHQDFHALVKNPDLERPRIFYLTGEHMLGSQLGAGLGYVIFNGNLNNEPKKVSEVVFERIATLKQMFVQETNAKGINVSIDKVGVYALNVRDT